MKKELMEFLEKHPLFKYELDGGSEQQVINALDQFFDQYQTERSKREDFDEYTSKKIDWALDRAFNESLDQESFDILLSVCNFAKMRGYEKDNKGAR